MKKILSLFSILFIACVVSAQRPAYDVAICPVFQKQVWAAMQNEAKAIIQDSTRHELHQYASFVISEPMQKYWLNTASAAVVTAFPVSDTTCRQDSIQSRVHVVFPMCARVSQIK